MLLSLNESLNQIYSALSEAREKREDCRKQIDEGYNPSEIRKMKKLEQEEEYKNNFEAIAREWHTQRI